MNATYDQTAAYYSRQREAQFRDEIHAYGQMPNSIETGWYLVGYRSDVEREYQL
jgi:hypothetical protein